MRGLVADGGYYPFEGPGVLGVYFERSAMAALQRRTHRWILDGGRAVLCVYGTSLPSCLSEFGMSLGHKGLSILLRIAVGHWYYLGERLGLHSGYQGRRELEGSRSRVI